MPYFKIPYSGYAIVGADSPKDAVRAYEDGETLLEEETQYRPELLDADAYNEILSDFLGGRHDHQRN